MGPSYLFSDICKVMHIYIYVCVHIYDIYIYDVHIYNFIFTNKLLLSKRIKKMNKDKYFKLLCGI